MFNIKMKIQV